MRTRSLITGQDTGALYRLFVRQRRHIMTPPNLARIGASLHSVKRYMDYVSHPADSRSEALSTFSSREAELAEKGSKA